MWASIIAIPISPSPFGYPTIREDWDEVLEKNF
jgi:hypothetical protein